MPGSDYSRTAMAAGVGGLGAGLAGLFGSGSQNPYNAASSYYNKIPSELQKYFDPYINQGQQAGNALQGQYGALTGELPGLQNQYSQLMNDPNSVLNKIGSGYQQSPGYQWQYGQAMNAANNAAAAGGMAGSPQHQQQAATVAQGLANQDYYNYVDKALGLYGTGLQGGQNLYGMGLQGLQGMNQLGYNASDELGMGLANLMQNQAGLAYRGAADQNAARGAQWGDIFGGLGALASFGGFI